MKIQKGYQALIYLGILILTAQIGFRVYVLCNSKDIPPIDDSDLLLVRPNITPDQNAYSIFTSATNNLYYPEDIDLEMDYIWSDDDSEPITEAQIIEVIKKNKNLNMAKAIDYKRIFDFNCLSSNFCDKKYCYLALPDPRSSLPEFRHY